MWRILTLFVLELLAFGNSFVLPSNDSTFSAIELEAKENSKERCMDELGCFSIPSDFKHILYRPINVLPNDRAIINTKFLLYTRRNPKEPEQLYAKDKESITKSNFVQSNPVTFVVHGFVDTDVWMVKLKDEFLVYDDRNVIFVDWTGGNRPPYYQATANTRVVGAEIALFIQALNNFFGIKPEDCYVIGHSLGSHIAGYAGERLTTLGRITGLDPAEPYFQNMPPSVRLDTRDADYVDIIHTDATSMLLLGLGMSQKIGHVDFFPNNGRNQPGCTKQKITSFITDGLKEGTRRFASCDHQRSVDFMLHSINYRKVVPVGYECPSWDDFLDGKCADCGSDTTKCAIMGIRSDEYKKYKNDNVQHAFYLKTSSKSPFWLYHYRVTVKFFKPKKSFKDPKGSFEINLHGSKEDFLAKVQDKAISLVHGNSYQYLVTTDTEIGDIKTLTFQWKKGSGTSVHIEYISVVPMNVIEQTPRNDIVFCDKAENAIKAKTVTTLKKNSECIK